MSYLYSVNHIGHQTYVKLTASTPHLFYNNSTPVWSMYVGRPVHNSILIIYLAFENLANCNIGNWNSNENQIKFSLQLMFYLNVLTS